MKNKTITITFFFIVTCVMIITICLACNFWYYHPRIVEYELTTEISKPSPNFDRSHEVGFDYIHNEERLMFFMVKYYEKLSCIRTNLTGYDSLYALKISKQLNYEKYDYLIVYQKELQSLRFSLYLTKTKDDLYFDKRTPLIPTFDTLITDKVYIYQIKKNNKFRAPGP